MKRVAVSGGLGFIGSEFVNLLLRSNIAEEILVLDKETYAADINRLDSTTDRRLSFLMKDICDVTSEDLAGCDYIVNFAAETHVDNSIEDGRPFIRSNVEGVFNLLEQARKLKSLKKFVQISTDEVYGDMGESTMGAAPETHPIRPSSYYSATKAAGDMLVMSAHRTFGVPYLITRSCNNYGAKQDKEKFIPKIFECIRNDKEMPVYKDGRQIREWISVEDNVSIIASLMLMDSAVNTTINIGSGFNYCNMDIINMVTTFMKKKVKFKFVEDRLGHDFKYRLNTTKLQSLFPDYVFNSLEMFLEDEVKKLEKN